MKRQASSSDFNFSLSSQDLTPFDAARLLKEYADGRRKFHQIELKWGHLAEAHLPYIELEESLLQRAELKNANLAGASLNHTDLSSADLTGANLIAADLIRAKLAGADLSGACLSGANLSGANLRRANLRNCILAGANLSGVDFTGAIFDKTFMGGATFKGANLSSVNLDSVDLTDLDLEGSILPENQQRAAWVEAQPRQTAPSLPPEPLDEPPGLLAAPEAQDQDVAFTSSYDHNEADVAINAAEAVIHSADLESPHGEAIDDHYDNHGAVYDPSYDANGDGAGNLDHDGANDDDGYAAVIQALDDDPYGFVENADDPHGSTVDVTDNPEADLAFLTEEDTAYFSTEEVDHTAEETAFLPDEYSPFDYGSEAVNSAPAAPDTFSPFAAPSHDSLAADEASAEISPEGNPFLPTEAITTESVEGISPDKKNGFLWEPDNHFEWQEPEDCHQDLTEDEEALSEVQEGHNLYAADDGQDTAAIYQELAEEYQVPDSEAETPVADTEYPAVVADAALQSSWQADDQDAEAIYQELAEEYQALYSEDEEAPDPDPDSDDQAVIPAPGSPGRLTTRTSDQNSLKNIKPFTARRKPLRHPSRSPGRNVTVPTVDDSAYGGFDVTTEDDPEATRLLIAPHTNTPAPVDDAGSDADAFSPVETDVPTPPGTPDDESLDRDLPDAPLPNADGLDRKSLEASEPEEPDESTVETAAWTTQPYDWRSNPHQERVVRSIQSVLHRRIQYSLQRKLLEVYGKRCAITGCNIVPLLETVLINSEEHTAADHPSNGLVLRSDIKTLYELHLIAIHPVQFTVMLAPSLKNSEYGNLLGQKVYLPQHEVYYPNQADLQAHLNTCKWNGNENQQDSSIAKPSNYRSTSRHNRVQATHSGIASKLAFLAGGILLGSLLTGLVLAFLPLASQDAKLASSPTPETTTPETTVPVAADRFINVQLGPLVYPHQGVIEDDSSYISVSQLTGAGLNMNELDAAITIEVDSRSYVPVSYVKDLGIDVAWDADTRTVILDCCQQPTIEPIALAANDRPLSQSGQIIQDSAYIPIDILRQLNVDQSQIAETDLVELDGQLYAKANSLKEQGTEVSWNADTRTLNFIPQSGN
jgi:uncharacterized protein YjbI with pentapeptide repeats